MATLGRTAAEAFFRAYFLRQACSVQLKVMYTGDKMRLRDPKRVARYQEQMCSSEHYNYDGSTEWTSLLRKLDRQCPDYKTYTPLLTMPDLPATPDFSTHPVSFEAVIRSGVPILGEGSMYERLRRDPAVEFDPYIAHASLIYDPVSASVLEKTHKEYLDIGQKYGLPMVVATATWRANAERISQSRFRNKAVNQDNVAFMRDMCASYGASAAPIFVDAIVGPRGDAYRPQEAPGRSEAEKFHAYQIEALAGTDVDQLIAMTLPAFDEAFALATLMAQTVKPYMLSFVIRKNGRLLDGTPLRQVIEEIDATIPRPPAGYEVNCVHPSVFAAGLQAQGIIGTSLAERIFGLCANTSAREPEELDGLEDLDTEEPESFATSMWETYASAGSKYLGGCCGTSTEHIEAIARRWSSRDKD